MPAHLLHSTTRQIPGQCAVCMAWPAEPVCEACVVQFAQPRLRCSTCATALASAIGQCGACVREPPPLDACVAAVHYAFPWSALLLNFKFHGQPGWAAGFATLMRSAPWVEPALDQANLVLPMPLSRERLRERGFNQSLELARQLAPRKVDSAILLRTLHTMPQSALGRAERMRNVRHAFAVEPGRAHVLDGARVVLVDDVMTSGASLFAAAQTLRDSGVRHITGLVLARADPPALRDESS